MAQVATLVRKSLDFAVGANFIDGTIFAIVSDASIGSLVSVESA